MSNYFRFLNKNHDVTTSRRLGTRIAQVLIVLILACSLVGISPTSVLADNTTYYVDKTNPACSDATTGPQGTIDVPFCTLTRGAIKATAPGDIVRVIAGTYAETIYPNSGIAGSPISFLANPGVTVTGDSAGFGSAFALGGKSYVVIDGFNITQTKYKGIYVDSSNHITITNNHVTYAGINAGADQHQQGIYLRSTTYSTVTNNITDHNSCIGIRLINNSNYNTVSNNISFANSSTIAYPIVAVSDAAGIELTGSNNNTVINNTTYGNEDSGINIYVNSTGVPSSYNLIIGNLSYGNGDHGIDHNNSPYNTVVGNTAHGNGTTGINFEGDSIGSHHATVANNISAGNGFTPPTGSFGGNLRVDSTSTTGTTLDYSLVYRQSAAVQIIWNNDNYVSLATFRAAVPSQEVHGLEANPLFVAPVSSVLRVTGTVYLGSTTTGDYYLNPGSPVIDSANSDAPSEPLTDINGNARIDDPAIVNTGAGTRTYDDRGAYEYLPSGTSLPTVTTQAVTAITMTTATGNGNITAPGAPNPTQHGVVWSTLSNPTILDSKTEDGPVSAAGAFTSSITGLTPGTLYHVRAYATNTEGTAYGSDVSFTTLLAPTVTTQAVTSITAATAIGNGNVTALGIPNPTQHGVVWSTSADPTTADSKTTDGAVSATGTFTSIITGLTPGTLYHLRAYATNTADTAYGEDVTFTTLIVPTVTTQAVTNIGTTTATGNGNVTALGIPNPTQHGVVWGTAANPTTANSKTTNGAVSATGAFTSNITGLTPNTLYHVRAYATNTAGTAYGEDVTFTTLLAPTVTTQAVTDITTTTATGNGNITVLGTSDPTEHGVVWGTLLNPTIADSKTTDGSVSATGAFTSNITGLTPGTLYHVRAYATNVAGTSYGADVTFTALIAPTVTTQAVTNIGNTTATGNGNLTVLGVPNPTQHGVVWSTSVNPTIADSKTTDGSLSATGPFTSNITGLALGMEYHVRAYATNSVSTAYGNDVTFTTLPSSTSTTTPITNARSGANVSGVGTIAWLNPSYVTADDSSYATATLTNQTSNYLQGTNYGFAIPLNATINGIAVTIGRFESGIGTGTDVRDSVVSLMKAGVVTGTNKAATATEWPITSPVAAVYGTTGDLWGTTWTPVDINDSNFGVALAANSVITRMASVDYMQISVTYTVTVVSSSTSVSCGAGTPVATYGSDITCVATVVRGTGSNTPTGNVSWTTDGSGSFVTSPCALSGTGGTATCSVTYAPSSVGSGAHLISAAYAGDESFFASNGTQTVTVNKKDASVTPTAASKTYGDVDPALDGTLVGFLPADGVTAAYSRAVGETVADSPYTISATLSPSGVLANYNVTNNTANFTINKKAVSVTLTAASKTYGEDDPALTGALVGFLPADGVTATYSRAAGETVADSPYAISAVLSPLAVLANYDITTTAADFTINKKDASVTLDAANKTYGDVDPALTGSLVGFVPADGVTAAYSRAAGETVADSPYAISVVLSPVEALANYNITNTPANFTINKKDASVTPDAASKPLGEPEPVLTGSLVGFLPADSVTATYSREAGETVEDSPYTISAVLNPAEVLPNYNVIYNTADFTITPPPDEYTLTLTKFGNGTITASPEKPTYRYGDVVTLTATADPGWSFFNWSPNVTGGTVTIRSDTTVSAVFTQDEYTLTINKVGNGTVTKAPSQATYHYGDVVTLTATPDAGWSFDSWSANATGGTVTISGTTTVTATFIADEYTLSLSTNGNGSITATPSSTSYHYGDVVALTATPDLGWSFGSWSANVVAGSVTIQGNTTVTANFTHDEYTLVIDKVGNGTVTKEPDQATYYYGETVALTQTPAAGWSFGGWSENVVAGSVLIQGNTTVTATFIQDEYTLAIDKTGNGAVAKDPDQATYHYGDVVTLTATPDAGWSFGSWSANVVDGKVTINANTTVSVTFTQDEYTLTLSKVGNGAVTGTPVQATYHYGDVVNLTATPDAGWSFGSWSANVVAGTVTINGNTTVTATFTQDEYTLTLSKVGNGTVAGLPDQTTYHYGDIVDLTATPDAGWSFGNWSSNVVDGKVTINANTTVTATFVQDEYSLTINLTGNGTVAATPDQPTYHYGDVVNLTATPDLGWSFGSWSANATGGSVTINGNTIVSATFTQDEYTLTIIKIGSGTVEIVPDQPTYQYGESVQLTATPDAGWGFSGWSGAISGSVNPQSVTMNGNKNITATFNVLSLPTVTTQAVTDITTTTATGNGNITEIGVPNATEHGVVWSTAADPTLLDSKTTEGSVTATGAFTSNITGLTPGTLYHVRAYATNTEGTAYGEDVTFTTLQIPTVTTQAVTDITTTTATGNGNVTVLGIPNPTEHGVVWSLAADPTTADDKTTEGAVSATGAFTSNITGLTPGTLYHVRAYATNEVGTAYGEDVTFTAYIASTVTTEAVSSIGTTTATGNGTITSLGVPNPTQHGVVWSTSADPTISDSKTTDGPFGAVGAFTSNITGLTPGTLYHVRAYATNEVGTFYGEDVTFTTLLTPTVTTQAVTNITLTTATGNGNITALGLPGATQYGVVWDTAIDPTIALATKTEQGVPAGTGAFTSNITGLTSGVLYHVRAYATNTVGTAYGEDVTFTALQVPTVTTQAVSSIGTSTATGNGNVTSLGVPNPTQHGFVWATTVNPTIANSKTTNGPVSATGAFTGTISDLVPATQYHVRAYATNTAGTSYGADVTFTTLPATAVVFNSSGSWTVPAGVTSITVEVWGGGGRGGSISGTSFETTRGGGGGGAYSLKSNIAVTPGTSYSYTVGAGATGTGAGGDSYFINTSTVLAKGGNSVGTSSTGVSGGSAASGVGDVKYSGGTGANGNSTNNYSGGGGSSAGTAVNGTNATNATGATAPAGGGNGGNGRSDSSGPGVAGSTPGGAGGGAYRSGYSSTSQTGGSGANGQIRITYYVSVKSTTTSVNCGAGTPSVIYGSSINCVATVTASSGTTSPSGSVAWTTNGAGSIVTSPCTLSGTGGSATCSVTYTPSSVGTGSHLITASYAGNTNFLASNGNQTVTVNTKTASVTPTAASKTYGDVDPALTGSLVGFLPADGVTATYSRAAGETVVDGPYTISGTLSPAGALANYTVTYNTANFTINKMSASVTPTLASKTYGEDDPASFTGTLSGFLLADGVTATYSRAAGDNAGAYPISAELSPLGVLPNYDITYNPVNFTIEPKAASVTPNDASKAFGADDPILTGSLVGFLPADNVTATYSRVAGETVEGSPYTISAELSPLGVLPNYAITYNTANFTITQAEYTLTIDIVGSGTVTRSLPAPYHQGDVVTLTPAPELGWSFGSWSANVVDGSVTIDGNTTVTATFTQNEYTLTIDSVHGTVAQNPSKATYHEGDVVTLTATANTGWTFENWTGDLVSILNPDAVTIHGNTTVTANYTEVINVAPAFTSTAVTSADEDALYTYNITATDANIGDTLTISAPTLPAWLTFTDNGGGSATLSGTPTNAEVGSHAVVLQVSDGTLSGNQTFSIAVANTNDAPTFTSTAITSAAEDVVYTYNVTVSDPDAGAILTLSAPTLPAWLTLTDNLDGTALLTGTPTNGDVGINNVTLRVNDGVVDVDQVFTIDVGNTNDGPSFTSTAVTTVNEDAVYTYDITATDPDAGDTLTISATTLPTWLTLTDNGDGTATLTGTPTNSEVGDHSVVLQVSDSVELATQSFTITVANTNDAPVLAQPADQNNAIGAVVSLQISATDVDAGDTLTYSATGLPADLSINPASGLITGTLTVSGTSTISVTVNDGNGGTDSKSFGWTVTEPTYTLTVNKVGNGTVTADNPAPYYLNDVVVLTAVADEGWTFSGWTGDCTGTGDTCSVTMDADKTVTATFTQNQTEYTLTVNKVGNGTVTPDKVAPYYLNDVVVLTAAADEGWTFSGWTGDCTGTGTCSVMMDADKTVTATFTHDIYTLTVNKVGNGTVTPDKVAPYYLNDVVVLTAVADEGWTFSGWTGDCTGTGTCSVTMNADKSVIATFTQTVHPTHTIADFNGDGKTDLSVFKVEPWAGMWYIKDQSVDAYGNSNSTPVPCDYNGDGVTDIAVYNDGTWYVKDQFVDNWGDADSIPVPGDYNGDGTCDLAVFKVEPWAGMWYIKDQGAHAYGNSNSIPVPADYNGDGIMDIAVYNEGTWYVKDQFVDNWGDANSIPVPGDYNGDGSADLAVFKVEPWAGMWYIKDQAAHAYGNSNSIPMPGDYNGDGMMDVAVYNDGTWYVKDQFVDNWGDAMSFPLPARDTNGDGDPYQ